MASDLQQKKFLSLILTNLRTVSYKFLGARRKLPGEWISDLNFAYDMLQNIVLLVTYVFRLALK